MNKVRVIGGKWKRRLVQFESADGLRPTPDRVRETLFNWLMWDIQQKTVLDLCAGSGILGIEALSRGASSCVFIEPNTKQAQNIKQHLQLLGDQSSIIIKGTAQNAVNKITSSFDMMFLDPPYSLNLWATLATLYDAKLNPNALIYVEADRALEMLNLPQHWLLQKSTKAGMVHAGLFLRQK